MVVLDDGRLVDIPAGVARIGAAIEAPGRIRVTTPFAVLRFGERSWGVQFHPEFDGEIMRHFLAARAEAIVSEGLDLGELERRARDTPDAQTVFRNFVRLVAGV